MNYKDFVRCEVENENLKITYFCSFLYFALCKELPQSIQIVPSDALLPSYEADYNEMRSSFIYGESLDFSALMKRMAELQERFRKISTEQ